MDLSFINKLIVFILVLIIIAFAFIFLIKYGSNFLFQKIPLLMSDDGDPENNKSIEIDKKTRQTRSIADTSSSETQLLDFHNLLKILKHEIDEFKTVVVPSLNPELLLNSVEKYKSRKNIVIDDNYFKNFNAIKEQEIEINRLKKEILELNLKNENSQ